MNQREFRIGRRNSAIRAGIFLGICTAGFLFDYGIIDDAMVYLSAPIAGWNLPDGIDYFRYHLKGSNEED